MLERILVPLDGSLTAETVLPHVRRLVGRRASELVLVGAADAVPSDGGILAYDAELAAKREYLLGIQERLIRQGLRARTVPRMGVPSQVILDVARDERAGLIAMATHGRTGLARVLLGSVAEQVIRQAPVPVLAVRPFWSYEIPPAGRVEDRPILNILVPVDGSAHSLMVAPYAAELARLSGATMTFLQVVEPGARGCYEESASQYDQRMDAPKNLDQIAASHKAQGLDVTVLIREGDPAWVIQKAAQSEKADLIAMTTHGRSGLSRLVAGSVAEKVLRAAEVPLLLVSGKAAAPIPANAGSGKENA